jgi:hypothetical protein
MTPPEGNDWKDLEVAWKAAGEDVTLSEAALHRRQHRQRALLAAQNALEIASFVLAALVALWLQRQPFSRHLGVLLVGWLILQSTIVLYLRRRQHATDTASVLDGLDASIEQDDRLVRSLRLGGVMSMFALAAIILATAHQFFTDPRSLAPAPMLAIGVFVIYVFFSQVVIVLWARRVRMRRQKLDDIRRAMAAPERSDGSS